ncbi:MAG: hypothetical protein AAB654_02935 [Acidobacteriota bacterium]
MLAWAALCALARRPRDAGAESRLLGRLNAFHYWPRHYTLKVLEAWNPDDATLAARVLLRLDSSWASAETAAQFQQSPGALDRGDEGRHDYHGACGFRDAAGQIEPRQRQRPGDPVNDAMHERHRELAGRFLDAQQAAEKAPGSRPRGS